MNEKFILTVIEKFDTAKIDELDFSDGTSRFILRKGLGAANALQKLNMQDLPDSSATASAEIQSAAAQIKAAPLAESQSGIPTGAEKITSPIVATFYAAPGPDAPAFVKAGSKVKTGQTLCILEAMKMMNHLEAEYDCEICEIHAASGDFVEFGQTLFTVKRI